MTTQPHPHRVEQVGLGRGLERVGGGDELRHERPLHHLTLQALEPHAVHPANARADPVGGERVGVREDRGILLGAVQPREASDQDAPRLGIEGRLLLEADLPIRPDAGAGATLQASG